MSRLWDRGGAIDEAITRFTVGRDPELDLRLLPHDALASAAHATMLGEIGVLKAEEVEALVGELAAIARDTREGRMAIAREDEDGHTAIENRLTAKLGDAGRRIHTGRSRNDQVIAALRLWGREMVLSQLGALLDAAERLLALAEEHREVAVAGYTHTRQAMPSTMGFLFAAHAEALLDAVPWLRTAYDHVNRSPLGSASGYGVALPLNRARVAQLLGFREVQRNTLAVQNDRGKTEYLLLGAALAPALDLGRLATDLIWFSSEELGYVRLAEEVTTGSSIMPQKRNPDVLELIRAAGARLRSRHAEIAAVYAPLASGYQRDLQLTKEPFLEGMVGALDILTAMRPVLDSLEVDPERCRAALQKSIAATDALYRRVAAGEPFRTAYKAVAADPEAAVNLDPADAWRLRTYEGAPGALAKDPDGALAPDRQRLEEARGWLTGEGERVAGVWALLPE
jgi:argininosuccinate lyase